MPATTTALPLTATDNTKSTESAHLEASEILSSLRSIILPPARTVAVTSTAAENNGKRDRTETETEANATITAVKKKARIVNAAADKTAPSVDADGRRDFKAQLSAGMAYYTLPQLTDEMKLAKRQVIQAVELSSPPPQLQNTTSSTAVLQDSSYQVRAVSVSNNDTKCDTKNDNNGARKKLRDFISAGMTWKKPEKPLYHPFAPSAFHCSPTSSATDPQVASFANIGAPPRNVVTPVTQNHHHQNPSSFQATATVPKPAPLMVHVASDRQQQIPITSGQCGQEQLYSDPSRDCVRVHVPVSTTYPNAAAYSHPTSALPPALPESPVAPYSYQHYNGEARRVENTALPTYSFMPQREIVYYVDSSWTGRM
mmetsp:Transcript_27097/g.42082  ORF Transcript_27097/g.42082 Transcript_27097/m.42082 type:complete len:370 (+) Transcript_27097:102-1211(+)